MARVAAMAATASRRAETNLWGITHWVIENNVVTKEWTTFNEFGVLMPLNR